MLLFYLEILAFAWKFIIVLKIKGKSSNDCILGKLVKIMQFSIDWVLEAAIVD